MPSALALITHHYLIVLFSLYFIGAFIIVLLRQPVWPDKASDWPITEGTIQSVGGVVVGGRNAYTVDAGDFSYQVDNEYYSGRLTISRSFSTGDRSPKDLINQKIQVRYNPRKPEKFSVPQAELRGFLLDPYFEPFGKDIGSIDLNIDKI